MSTKTTGTLYAYEGSNNEMWMDGQDVECTVDGNTITMDGRQIWFDDLSKLPDVILFGLDIVSMAIYKKTGAGIYERGATTVIIK